MKYHLGLDYICIDKEYLYQFLIFAKHNHISIYSLSYNHEYCYFYCPLTYRHLVRKFNQPYKIIKTIGFISYIFILFKNYQRIIFMITFLFSLLFYSKLIFQINIEGIDSSINKDLHQYLKRHDIDVYQKMYNYEKLNELLLDLKEEYKYEIEYINIYKEGSSFNIKYIKRNKIDEIKTSYKPIYANKNGIIYKIDVSNGLIKVKLNDYVSKGDLLVDNNIITTNNKTEMIPVKGHVYAYTFETYSATCLYKESLRSDLFYKLLFEIRKKLPINAVIDKENVLQIEVNHSKITLTMQYTLIEDISVQGD